MPLQVQPGLADVEMEARQLAILAPSQKDTPGRVHCDSTRLAVDLSHPAFLPQQTNISFFILKCASNHLNKMILLRGRGHYKFGRFFDSFAPNKLFAMIFEHVSVPFSHRGKLKITVAALERGHALHILVHLENMLLNVPFGAEHFAANVALKWPLLLMHTLNMFFQAHFIRVLFSALRAHGFDRLMNVS